MNRKLVLIGAGSAMFTQGLVMDFIRYSKNSGDKWTIALVDIEPNTLEAVAVLCRKMLHSQESDIELSWSVDRKEVLPGADYVVTTIGVGGRRAWEKDVFIPRKFGIFQPVGDSVAPGGISRAMRMIPAMIDIARDVAALCPKAKFFNYANPMTAICRAINKDTDIQVTGLCHGVKNGIRRVAGFLGLDASKMTAWPCGLNHMVFIYDFRYDGESIWPDFLSAIEKCEQEGRGWEVPIGPITRQFVKDYGVYVASDDRHFSEFRQEFLSDKAYFGKTLGVDAYSFENTISEGDEIYDRTLELANNSEQLPASFFNRFEGEHEQLTEIIDSLEHDQGRIFPVNIPNIGSVDDISKDFVLEVPAAASSRGFLPLYLQDVPEALKPFIKKHAEVCELTVDAALNGDRKLFVEAILHGGCQADKDTAERLVDELIEAQAEYLPHFK